MAGPGRHQDKELITCILTRNIFTEMVEKICKNCNSIFMTNSTSSVCSDECRIEYRKSYRKNRWKNCPQTERICFFCQKIFMRRVLKNGKFCSRSCGSKWHIKNGDFDKWKTCNHKKCGTTIKCAMSDCQNMIYLPPRFNNMNVVKLCGLECEKKYFSLKMSGENNPMFRKKLSKESENKKRKTLLKNHGVANAFLLSKRRTISKAHHEIFNELNSKYSNMHFEKEKMLRTSEKDYFIDIVSNDCKIAIEYNGDYWHCNPVKYQPDFMHHVKLKTASEIWNDDKNRINIIEKNGYEVIVIWESDYRKFRSEVMNSIFRRIDAAIEKENTCTL